MNRCACFTIALLAGLPPASGQSVLPDDQRTNGAETLKAVANVQHHATESSVLIGKSKEKSLAGIVLSPDGYVLTQASDTGPLKPLRAFLPDGSSCEVREVKRDDRLNLLLVKMERTGLQAITWDQALSLRAGQWLCSLTKGGQRDPARRGERETPRHSQLRRRARGALRRRR